jgi:NTP pyrophosphatase (non-canonical NTP hydrolase)
MRQISEQYEDFLLACLKQNPGRPEEAQIFKVGEEVGEVVEAYLSYRGWNWRKANGASAWEVCMELADVAMTAMAAITVMGYGPDQLIQAQMEKNLKRMEEIRDHQRSG